MKVLTEQELQKNYEELIQIIKDTFEEESERRENLLKMYQYFEDRMCIAPASGKLNYHYAFVGGYVLHVLNVVEASKKITEVFKQLGGVVDYTDEELVFTALHHDLGKVGDLEDEYYIVNEDDWRRKKFNEIFTNNPKMQFMSVTDRSLYLLGHFNVPVSQKEWLAIKVSDGMYDEANVQYLKTYRPEKSFHSSLPHIIHWADHLSTRAEYSEWKYLEHKQIKKVEEEKEQEETILSEKSKDLFEELFGDMKKSE